jgi:hypothetical protein
MLSIDLLNSRSPAAKPEWAIWVATMAESKETFEEFVAPIHRCVDETRTACRSPTFTSRTRDGRRANHARSVVGGFYINLLAEKLSSVL